MSAEIRISRGKKSVKGDLLYGEFFYDRHRADSEGTLYIGDVDDDVKIAGERAMTSMYFQGTIEAMPSDAVKGDVYVVAKKIAYQDIVYNIGDWAIATSPSTFVKAIHQGITVDHPFELEKNPLHENEGLLKLRYDSKTLVLNADNELTVSNSETYITAFDVTAGMAVGIDVGGVFAANNDDLFPTLGIAKTTGNTGEFIEVLRTDTHTSSSYNFDIGYPVYLFKNGAMIQNVEEVLPGEMLQCLGTAIGTQTLEINIGTPFIVDSSDSVYYIPLSQEVDESRNQAPSNKALTEHLEGFAKVNADDVQTIPKIKASEILVGDNALIHVGSADPVSSTRLVLDATVHTTNVVTYGGNDIADFLEIEEKLDLEYGACYAIDDSGHCVMTTKYNQMGLLGICTDTQSVEVGRRDNEFQIPIAIGGFVLAKTDAWYRSGTPLTSGTIPGVLTSMSFEDKRDYPERIVGTYLRPESNTNWLGRKVNNRHWVKVK